MKAIIFATSEEAEPFLQGYRRGRFDGLTEGEVVHDDDLLVTITGTGKIKAALRTERFLRAHRPSRIIHAGTCTTLVEKIPVGSLLAPNQVFEGDRIELAAPTYPRMPLLSMFEDLPSGTLVTQDHTVQGSDELSYWQRIADVADMSGYAVAYVAATHGVPCAMVKAVSGRMGVDDADLRKTMTEANAAVARFLISAIKGG